MLAKELLGKGGQLFHKRRSQSDLIRHIGNREGDTSNYSVLLGAGASVTSGVRSAGQLINEWIADLYILENEGEECNSIDEAKEYFEEKHADWYNSLNPYSSLFEKKYDFASQRRRFVESEVDSKLPSIGYAYLTSLISKSYFNVLFTTNFDDLINESFYQFADTRPIVCAHDSSIKSISITSKRPKIIKLHGDYLFNDIKSTERETESLEINTREKFIEFCKEYGLIVVGYAGCDRSIMDVLEFLLRNDNYLKDGIYWCLRENDTISTQLKNLLWKDKVHPVLIDGFDEFFAETFHKLNNSNLDLENNLKHSKLQSTVQNIIKDDSNLKTNQYIRREIDNLKIGNDTRDISDFFIQSIVNDEDKNLYNNKRDRSLTTMKNLLEVDSLISKDEFDTALPICQKHESTDISLDSKASYIKRIVQIYQKKSNFTEAKVWTQKLVELDEFNVEFQLYQISALSSNQEKLSLLKKLLKKFPYDYQVINKFCSLEFKTIKHQKSTKDQSLKSLLEKINKSLIVNPSLRNSAWELKFSVLLYCIDNKVDKTENSEEIKRLINTANESNPVAIKTQYLIKQNLSIKRDYDATVNYITNLKNIISKSDIDKSEILYEFLYESQLDIYEYGSLKDEEIIKLNKMTKDVFNINAENTSFINNSKLMLFKALSYLVTERSAENFKIYYEHCLNAPDSFESIQELINFAKIYDESAIKTELLNLYQKTKNRFVKSYSKSILSDLCALNGDFDKAIEALDDSFKNGLSKNTYLNSYSYLLTRKNDFDKIIELYETNKSILDDEGSEVIFLNYQFALIKRKKAKDKIKLSNIAAQSNSINTKICAFILLDQQQPAIRLIKSQFKQNYLNYFRIKSWPILKYSGINLEDYL